MRRLGCSRNQEGGWWRVVAPEAGAAAGTCRARSGPWTGRPTGSRVSGARGSGVYPKRTVSKVELRRDGSRAKGVARAGRGSGLRGPLRFRRQGPSDEATVQQNPGGSEAARRRDVGGRASQEGGAAKAKGSAPGWGKHAAREAGAPRPRVHAASRRAVRTARSRSIAGPPARECGDSTGLPQPRAWPAARHPWPAPPPPLGHPPCPRLAGRQDADGCGKEAQ